MQIEPQPLSAAIISGEMGMLSLIGPGIEAASIKETVIDQDDVVGTAVLECIRKQEKVGWRNCTKAH